MKWVEVNGVSLRYDRRGTRGPVLVLVHEMGGTLESWDRVLAHLPTDIQVLRFDMRGAGLSEKLTSEITWKVMADDIAALLDHCDLVQPVVLSGCAVGAGIAMQFAVNYPNRTAGIVVMNPAIDVPEGSHETLLTRAKLVSQQGMRSIEDISLDAGYPQNLRDRDPENWEQFRLRWLANDPASLGWLFRMLVNGKLFSDLPNITSPVLGLAGVHDPLRPPSYVEKVVNAANGSEVITVDAAHHVPDQAPKEVATHIAAFVKRVEI